VSEIQGERGVVNQMQYSNKISSTVQQIAIEVDIILQVSV
jgi:hypothetical protein